jgi:hypothetical protein
MIAGHIDAHRSALLSDVQAAEQAVDDLGERLRLAVRRLHQLREQFGDLGEVSAADVVRDVALLGRMPGVATVTTSGEDVLITTARVVVEHRGVRHDIGTFAILLSPSTGVRVWAIDRPPTTVAWEHPHVQAGRPCLGAARVGVEKLLGSYQYLAAGEIILRTLASFDEGTAYCSIDRWPVVG